MTFAGNLLLKKFKCIHVNAWIAGESHVLKWIPAFDIRNNSPAVSMKTVKDNSDGRLQLIRIGSPLPNRLFLCVGMNFVGAFVFEQNLNILVQSPVAG